MKNFTTAIAAAALLFSINPAHADSAIKDVLPTLPQATAPGAADHLMIVQGAVTKRLPGNTFLQPGGALGTPQSGNLANTTGLPISGISNLGTGIPSFLANPAGLVQSSWLATGLVVDISRITGLNNGLVKASGSNGTLGVAVSGTDYAPATSGTAILKASSGGFANAVAKTDYAPATTGTANAPLLNDGTGGTANGTRSGTTSTIFVTMDNSNPISGTCAQWNPDKTLGTTTLPCSTGSGSGSGITTAFAPIGWIPGVDPNNTVIMTATTAMTVTAIRGKPAAAVGAAATVTINKAPSGTACSGGTAQHTGSFNANGTANTNQSLTLAGSGANSLAAGDSLCLVTTGGANWTGGVGNGGITVAYTTP